MKRVLTLLACTALIGSSVGCCHRWGGGGGCQSGGCGYGAAPGGYGAAPGGYGAAPGVYQGAYYGGGNVQQAAVPYGSTIQAGIPSAGTTASASGYMYGPTVPVTASAGVNPLPTY